MPCGGCCIAVDCCEPTRPFSWTDCENMPIKPFWPNSKFPSNQRRYRVSWQDIFRYGFNVHMERYGQLFSARHYDRFLPSDTTLQGPWRWTCAGLSRPAGVIVTGPSVSASAAGCCGGANDVTHWSIRQQCVRRNFDLPDAASVKRTIVQPITP
jgi:hypothetical protein